MYKSVKEEESEVANTDECSTRKTVSSFSHNVNILVGSGLGSLLCRVLQWNSNECVAVQVAFKSREFNWSPSE